eukprot:TRINITY_DN23804_c0_g1_i1.p1 TRINITY_DN23804_c0_g1~~TRINITY_DN23804_c0_g1_i1.p1  ORF type:complete len:400 (-),score=64.83 TRINITY_DN23804_c0_g1_i1:213-1412(-)
MKGFMLGQFFLAALGTFAAAQVNLTVANRDGSGTCAYSEIHKSWHYYWVFDHCGFDGDYDGYLDNGDYDDYSENGDFVAYSKTGDEPKASRRSSTVIVEKMKTASDCGCRNFPEMFYHYYFHYFYNCSGGDYMFADKTEDYNDYGDYDDYEGGYDYMEAHDETNGCRSCPHYYYNYDFHYLYGLCGNSEGGNGYVDLLQEVQAHLNATALQEVNVTAFEPIVVNSKNLTLSESRTNYACFEPFYYHYKYDYHHHYGSCDSGETGDYDENSAFSAAATIASPTEAKATVTEIKGTNVEQATGLDCMPCDCYDYHCQYECDYDYHCDYDCHGYCGCIYAAAAGHNDSQSAAAATNSSALSDSNKIEDPPVGSHITETTTSAVEPSTLRRPFLATRRSPQSP